MQFNCIIAGKFFTSALCFHAGTYARNSRWYTYVCGVAAAGPMRQGLAPPEF